jgi:multidrug efflux pump subunit AcrA (membrane-fusion protein)
VIALWQHANAGVTQRLMYQVGARAQRWFGGENWLGRLLGAGFALLLIALFVPVNYRVSGDALLQTTEKYQVVAPQDGYLGEVLVRPGDTVKAATPLASLKDDDLLLERHKLASQVQRYRQAYDSALASADRVEAAIANAQMDQARSQLRLIEQQLLRTKLLAPIHCIVVSDDISQRQGAPLKQGDLLFELAAVGDYLVHMFIDERDIAAIAKGQSGQVKFTGLPSRIFTAQVTRITPISEVREGRNYFRIELRLTEADQQEVLNILRPGMTGSGKVSAGNRSLGWVWFHDLWYWLRLSLW